MVNLRQFFILIPCFIIVNLILITPKEQLVYADGNSTLGQSFATRVAGDVVVAGVGTRNNSSGTINLTGIPAGATVQKAFLYWLVMDWSLPSVSNTVSLNGNPITGAEIGSTGWACWSDDGNVNFRADVTSLVTANGAYTVTGLPASFGNETTDATYLVVIYNDPAGSNHDIVIYDGAVSLTGDGASSTISIGSYTPNAVPPTNAKIIYVVGDGQSSVIVDGNPQYNGTSIGGNNDFNGTQGNYLDIETYDVTTLTPNAPVNVRLNSGGECLIWGSAILSVTAPISASIGATDANGTEFADDGLFTVSLDSGNNTGSPIVVNYTLSGTATAGTDYTPLSGSVSIPIGSSNATIPLDVLDDTDLENTEAVTITLAAGTGYVIGSPDNATVTITDAETVIITANDANASENPLDNGQFTVLLSGTNQTGSNVVVNYTVTGNASSSSDYVPLIGSVSIGNTLSSAVIDVTPIDDALLEGAETVTVTLTTISHPQVSVGAFSSDTVTITDDEVTFVNILANDADAAENPLDNGQFIVTMTTPNNTGIPITVNYTVTGTTTSRHDYAMLPGSVIIPNGSSSATIELQPIDDTMTEGNETVIVTLTSTDNSTVMIGSPQSATITIVDNEISGADESNPVTPITSTVYSDSDFILKSVDRSIAQIGDTLTYTITFKNPKGITLNTVVISDTLDRRLNHVTAVSTSLGSASVAGNTVTAQGFNLLPGQSATVVIRATISDAAQPGDLIFNAATLESPDASIHVSNTATVTILPGILPATGESPWWHALGRTGSLIIMLMAAAWLWISYLPSKRWR